MKVMRAQIVISHPFESSALLQLSFGMPDGVEMSAADLRLINDTHATALSPPYEGATYFAPADISLTGEGLTFTPAPLLSCLDSTASQLSSDISTS